MFELDERLDADTCWLGDFPLCRVLLMRDANFPWLILVPRRVGVTEIFQLEGQDQLQLMLESSCVSGVMMRLFSADKMNIAALGNMVPQLHVHHIARFRSDLAWPKPVWGCVPPKHYDEALLQKCLEALKQAFSTTNLHFEVRT